MNKGNKDTGTPKRPRHREESLSPNTPPLAAKKFISANHTNNTMEQALALINKTMVDMQREAKGEMRLLNQSIDTKFGNWQAEKAEIVRKQSELESRIDQLERQAKRNSVIVTGLPLTDSRNAKSAVNDLFCKQLGVDVTVTEAFAVKMKSGDTKIIAKMCSFEDKMNVMKNKSKGTKLGKIFISDDMIRKDQYVQFKARQFAKDMRAMNKEAKVGHGRVFVDGTVHIWDEGGETFINRKN